MRRIKSIVKRWRHALTGVPTNGMDYWQWRVNKFGTRSVFNLGYKSDQLDLVTEKQKNLVSPLIQKQLLGNEELAIDIGCGFGRFTKFLADTIHGSALGLDFIPELVAHAPKSQNVDYLVSSAQLIPLKDAIADVIWINLVLGGITDGELKKCLTEILRVAKSGSLLFLIENTSNKKDADYWNFRSVEEYKDLFSEFELAHLLDFHEFGETISILAGRRVTVK